MDLVAMDASRVGLKPGKAEPAAVPATMIQTTGMSARTITQDHHVNTKGRSLPTMGGRDHRGWAAQNGRFWHRGLGLPALG